MGDGVNPSTIAAEISTALDTIAGLRIAVPGQSVVVPGAIVGMPTDAKIVSQGSSPLWRLEWPVWVLVGQSESRLVMDRLAEWLQTSGGTSIAAVLHGYAWTSCHYVRVVSAAAETVTLMGIDYAAAAYTLDIAGR
jgi:hypothetical protein